MKKKLKILSILGTRPEAIKMAPVINKMNATGKITSRICITAQHREMLDDVLVLFSIETDYDLNIMRKQQTPSKVASLILKNIESILENENPDCVLIQGDTTTVMAASIAAFHARIKIGHVEAGLRTYDKWHPFPEEINRRITTVLTDLHFAPTIRSRENLLHEGIPRDQIWVTGNTVVDSLKWAARQQPTNIFHDIKKRFGLIKNNSNRISTTSDKKLILVTAHRRENFGKPIQDICKAILDIVKYVKEARIVYPVHPNPNIKGVVYKNLANLPQVMLTQPLDYLTLVHLIKISYLILTDSGGIQEEAPTFGVPVLVLRDVTERPEAVQAGTVKVIGTSRERIVSEILELIMNKETYKRMSFAVNPYGDGLASERIVNVLLGKKIYEWNK